MPVEYKGIDAFGELNLQNIAHQLLNTEISSNRIHFTLSGLHQKLTSLADGHSIAWRMDETDRVIFKILSADEGFKFKQAFLDQHGSLRQTKIDLCEEDVLKQNLKKSLAK